MEELLVILGAELILLASIALMMHYNRRVDVLSHIRGFDETDHAASERRT